MSSERTEKASPQKKNKAAEQGDKLISRELIAAAATLCAVVALRRCCSRWLIAWMASYRASLLLISGANQPEMSAENIAVICRTIVVHCVSVMLVFSLSAFAGALFVGVVQGGGGVTLATIAPRLSRINPGSHVKSIFGMQSVIRMAKSFLPAMVVIGIAARKFTELQLNPVQNLYIIPILFHDVYVLLLGTALVMLIWSVVDYLNSWRSREARLKMSKQDVRDESKQSEGSPQIKRRIKSLQRQMRKRQLRVDVSKATVVVTNPTHYAVALKFDFVQMEPPRVLAKGRNLVAKQIREDAQWSAVPIVENPALARSLFRGVDVGNAIPFDLYAAVAAILAYLYRREMEAQTRVREATRVELAKRLAVSARLNSRSSPPR
jgi:flagellar biosynthetic protein FlhB